MRARTLAAVVAVTVASAGVRPAFALRRRPPTSEVQAAAEGRLPLSVVLMGSALSWTACAHAPCERTNLPAPDSVAVMSIATVKVGPRAEVVLVRGRRGADDWAMVLAGPRKDGERPERLFEGETAGPGILRLTEERGVTRIAAGREDPDVNLCGRKTLLGARELDPRDLSWKPVVVPRLTDGERASARRMTLKKRESDKAPLARVLSVVGASSALGSPQHLVDGLSRTAWAENKPGVGVSELVTFRAPREVTLTKLAFTVRPTEGASDHGVAPRTLTVATDSGFFELVFPEDAWRHPGRTYEAVFPQPVSTPCVAVMLGEAYADGEKAPEVTLAEVFAETTFDGTTDHAGLAKMLGAPGPDARAAQQMLMRSDAAGLRAVMEALPSLDGRGRAFALDVIDQAPCETSSPLYVTSLASGVSQEASHARARLVQCRPASVAALAAAAVDPKHPARRPAISEIVALSPDGTVKALGPLAVGDVEGERALVRGGVEHALGSPRAKAAYLALLAAQTTPRSAARALALLPAGAIDDGSRASIEASLAVAGEAFDETYIAMPGLALLASTGSAPALARLRGLLEHGEPRLRAAAALRAGRVEALEPMLRALAKDAEPRVREAAAQGLALAKGDAVEALSLLGRDRWAFVRRAAYEALAARASPAFDDLVVARLSEERSPELVDVLVRAVQNRKGGPGLAAVQRLAASDETPTLVRTTAARALGELCDQTSLELLTRLARKAEGAAADDDRRVGLAAVAALGRLHPGDLAARLSGLRGDGTPAGVRHVARAALEERDVCGR